MLPKATVAPDRSPEKNRKKAIRKGGERLLLGTLAEDDD